MQFLIIVFFFAYNSPSLMAVSSRLLYIWFLKMIVASRLQERKTYNEELYKVKAGLCGTSEWEDCWISQFYGF